MRNRMPREPALSAAGLILVSVSLLSSAAAHAADSDIPWECSRYEGAAQTRCLNAFIELQQEKIDQLEEQLRTQQGDMGELRNQVERQAAATADLQRRFADRPTNTLVPAPYPYVYAYPPTLGLGLYLGQPWFYGAPYYYYRPYWGPRYDRRWRHRR